MPTFIPGGSAVRLIVLLVVAGLALSWLHVRFSSEPDQALVDAPVQKESATQAKRIQAKGQRPSRQGDARSKVTKSTPRPAQGPRPGTGGRDIGWPQCPRNVGFGGRNGLGQPMPDAGVRFVIVGLTNGRAFTPNPCLAMHLRWVRTHKAFASAYAFAAYPSPGQLRRYRSQGPYNGHKFIGGLMNAGHAAALYNVRVMKRHRFVTPHVWLDVEPSSSRPWSGRPSWNSAVVRGWVRGYRDAGYTVGFYSTTSLWRSILGGLSLGLPEWRTAGPVSPGAALRKCHEGSFQGGRAVIAQWWTESRDYDRICPGQARATLSRYFHKW